MYEILKEYKMGWKDILYIISGSFLLSYSFQVFLLPNDIISGGVASLSIILYEILGISPAVIQYAFNIPLLFLSFIFLGKDVAFKSILGTLIYPFFTGLISSLEPLTTDPLLGAIFGGAITGIGVGLVYRGRGSTGGTSTVAQLISKYTGITLGNSTLLSDGIIIIIGFLTFDLEAILYGIISLIVASKMIDVVLVGGTTSKTVLIISDESEIIRQEILDNLERGVTILDARGGYRKDSKEMLMVVISEREITAMQEVIIKHDQDAFVVFMSASEVLGRGFSLEKYLPTNQRQ